MKSIRLSLILYFLPLIGLALGAMLVLLYQTTDRTLEDRLASRRSLHQANYESKCKTLKEEFDNQILSRAQTLANYAKSQWTRSNPRYLYSFGLLTAVANPHGHLLVPLWVGEATEGQFSFTLQRISFTKIQFAEDFLPLVEGHGDYFQIYSDRGTTLQHSKSMGEKSFTLHSLDWEKMELFKPTFDDTELAGIALRRVTFKTPVARFLVPTRGARPGPTPRPPREPSREPPPQRELSAPRDVERPATAIFIQYASETAERDKKLTDYHDELVEELANAQEEAATTLATVRTKLIWIGALTFAAMLAGCFFLVGLGLAPLRRMSDAVSRISEKNMSLQLKPAQLPLELRTIADRISQTLELLRGAFAREKQAAADISHELRTPLAALLTTIEVGLRRPRSAQEYGDLLKDCHAIGQQMSLLVERLLALARIDAGVATVREQEIDVAALADQCVSLVRPLAEARAVELQLHCQSPSRLATDPDKLREVLTNLLHNAVEYNKPNGKIDVTVERQNGILRLDVRDTGIGIPAASLPRVFERFYRADESRHADGLHAGVGLSIVKGYVELMGGTVNVDSKEGQGSTFSVRLPVR